MIRLAKACAAALLLATPLGAGAAEGEAEAERSWASRLFADWSVRPYAAAQMAQTGDTAYVATREGRLFAVAPDSGTVRWSRKLGNRLSGGPSIGEDGRLYVGDDEGQVWSLAPDTGETYWRSEVSSEVVTAPGLGGGMVLVRTADDALWALRANDGGVRWSFQVEGPSLALRGASEPVYRGGVVYAGFATGELIALDGSDGSPAWRQRIATPSGRTDLERMVDVDAEPVVLEDQLIAAAYNGAVVALSRDSGRELWNRDLSVYTNPVVAGDRVFVTTAEGRVTALDISGGGTVWTQKGLADAAPLSGPVITGDHLAVGDGQGGVTWLRQDTGHVAARLDLALSAIHGTPLALDGGGLLALSDEGALSRLYLE